MIDWWIDQLLALLLHLLSSSRHCKYTEALKAFCFVSVSVILPKQNPVSVKLPFPYWVFRLGYLFHIDCFGSVTLLMFQLPGFCFVSVSFVSYKCTLGRNLKMAGICLAILLLPLSLWPLGPISICSKCFYWSKISFYW